MAKKTASNLPKKQVVSLDNYSEINESELTALVAKYKNLVITKETFREAEKALSEVKQKRYQIQRIVKGNKDLLNAGKKTMEARGNDLIGTISPTEEYLQSGVDRVNEVKAEEKRKKEAERQRLQTERMEKINKLQKEFSSNLIQASILKNVDEIEKKLLAFEVTEEEFGDLKMACETTISGIQFDINMARTRIENEIEAESKRVLDEAKASYMAATGENWNGEDITAIIIDATNKHIVHVQKHDIITEYHSLGGEGKIDDTMPITELEYHLSEYKKELAEFARLKKEADKKAAKVKADLASKRLDLLLEAGIDDLEWAAKIQANDYPDKMIEDLTDEQFNVFKENLVILNEAVTEVDVEEKKEIKEVVNAEALIYDIEHEKEVAEPKIIITKASEIKVFVVETNEPELNKYTRYSGAIWTVVMGESDEPFYNSDEIEVLFQEYLKKATK